jgi:hypothetical protein
MLSPACTRCKSILERRSESKTSRGQGHAHARALLVAIEHRLADQGCLLLIADAWRNAEAFYRAQGWARPEAVLLRKRLTPTN